jgi:hypothetical protein
MTLLLLLAFQLSFIPLGICNHIPAALDICVQDQGGAHGG